MLSSELGNVAGLLAAGIVVFVLAPLQRLAERVAGMAMPHTRNTLERKLQAKDTPAVAAPGE